MKDLPKETQSQIMQLQLIEQNMQNFLAQKQTFQTQLLEVENALKQLEKTKETPYKIVGPIMIATDKDKLKKELKEKEETLNLRVKNLEKQEEKLKEKADILQKDVLKKIKK